MKPNQDLYLWSTLKHHWLASPTDYNSSWFHLERCQGSPWSTVITFGRIVLGSKLSSVLLATMKEQHDICCPQADN